MTDQPKTEWRDDEGHFLRRYNDGGALEFNAAVTGVVTITESDARFLLRYLPEALWRPTDTPCHECDHVHTKPGMCGAPALLGV